MSNTVQLNARVDKDVAEQLDHLATLTGRKKVWHLNEALRAYIAYETQFIEAVERGRSQARAGMVRPFEDYATELKERIDARRAQ